MSSKLLNYPIIARNLAVAYYKRMKWIALCRATPIDTPRVFVLGNQKSGTSAIAGLLGLATDLSVSIDFQREIWSPSFHLVFSGRKTFEHYIRRNSADFVSGIVKEPSMTYMIDHILKRFESVPVVLVVRNPLDNIRSLLDRHTLPGSTEGQSTLNHMSRPWRLVFSGEDLDLKGHNLVDTLALRWNKLHTKVINHRADITIVRYEDFVRDKQKVITGLAESCGLEAVTNIDSHVDRQFQPPGKKISDYSSYFGEQNYQRILGRCAQTASAFGYSL